MLRKQYLGCSNTDDPKGVPQKDSEQQRAKRAHRASDPVGIKPIAKVPLAVFAAPCRISLPWPSWNGSETSLALVISIQGGMLWLGQWVNVGGSC